MTQVDGTYPQGAFRAVVFFAGRKKGWVEKAYDATDAFELG